MHQAPEDLFGEVPITHADIAAWLQAVPRIKPDSPRAAWYVKAYSVTEKVRAAKLSGTFEQLTQARELPAYWWHRFNWD